ncbi:MAG: pilus assembly protein PilV [Rubrivivax sp.]|nr:pilus assembly protein PilV [Rubrivivax sp.]
MIEALVALAVMSFGMLGVVGMQSTMRTGADISRQRSEAVRIAQEELEELRNYSVLRAADAASGQLAFDQIVAAAAASVPAINTNTTFFLERVVPAAASAASGAMAPVQQVQVIVSWADRSASAPNQRVELSSAIAGLPPQMYGLHAMRTDRSPLRQAYGRNAAIPRVHISDNGDGTSTFTPPGLGGVTWIFNNATGLITKVCSAPSTPTCTTEERWLLSGFVAFATGGPPSYGEAEIPTDPVVSGLSMKVKVTLPVSTPDQACATEAVVSDRLAYYCALPTQTIAGQRLWSGRVEFAVSPSPGTLSTTLGDTTASNFKVCRYSRDGYNLVPTSDGDIPSGLTINKYNSRHPYSYYEVNGPQQNKNFLVISAGDGTDPFSCPAENPATPIESNTWRHQPIS